MQQDAINLANQLFTMWKNSAGHNASMLSKYCNVMGFGMHAVDLGEGVYSVYATQEFSYRKTKSVEEAPVVEEEVKEEEEEVKEEVKEEAPVVEEEVKEEGTVEIEDTVTEPTVEME